MKIVLTMAGLGQRFKDAGHAEEKYAIPFRGRTLFEWSLVSLLHFREHELVVVTRAYPDVEAHVAQTAADLGFARLRTIVLDRTTSGQAETACLAAPAFETDDSILIFNTDTYIDPAALRPEDIRGDGWIPCFEAPGDKWSFAEVDADGRVSRTTEKDRISDRCSVGVYYFSSFEGFVRLAEEGELVRGERYVAPLYNAWIAQGRATYADLLPEGSVTILGTPDDLAQAERLGRPVWPADAI